MAAQLANLFEPTELTGTGNTTVGTVPANTSWTVTAFTVSNNGSTSAAQKITIYWVPSGGAASAANQMDSFIVPLKPRQSLSVDAMIGQTLGPGDFIVCKADAGNALIVSASGLVGTA